MNGGECIDNSIEFHCNCLPGWQGSTCRQNINECLLKSKSIVPCQNNAACRDLPGTYECLCQPGWQGRYCEIPKSILNSNLSCIDSNCSIKIQKKIVSNNLNELFIIVIIISIGFVTMFIPIAILFYLCTPKKSMLTSIEQHSNNLKPPCSSSMTTDVDKGPTNSIVYIIPHQDRQSKLFQLDYPSLLNSHKMMIADNYQTILVQSPFNHCHSPPPSYENVQFFNQTDSK